jgi:hypothetical protein
MAATPLRRFFVVFEKKSCALKLFSAGERGCVAGT